MALQAVTEPHDQNRLATTIRCCGAGCRTPGIDETRRFCATRLKQREDLLSAIVGASQRRTIGRTMDGTLEVGVQVLTSIGGGGLK